MSHASRRSTSGAGKTAPSGIDRGPLDAEGVEGLVDVGTDPELVVCDRVTIHRACLADVARCLGTLAFRPSGTRLADAGNPAGHAEEVFVGGGVAVDKTGRVSDDADSFEPICLVECGGSTWDGGGG